MHIFPADCRPDELLFSAFFSVLRLFAGYFQLVIHVSNRTAVKAVKGYLLTDFFSDYFLWNAVWRIIYIVAFLPMDSTSERKTAFPEAVRGLGRLLFSLPVEVRTVLLQHPQQRKGCLFCGIGAHSVYNCGKTDDWKTLRRPRYAKPGPIPVAVSLVQSAAPIVAAQQSTGLTESPPLQPFPVASADSNFQQVSGSRWVKPPPATATATLAIPTFAAAAASAPASSRPAVARPAALSTPKAKASVATSPIHNQETTSQVPAPRKPASSTSAPISKPAADSSSFHLPDSGADKTHRNARNSSNPTPGKSDGKPMPQRSSPASKATASQPKGKPLASHLPDKPTASGRSSSSHVSVAGSSTSTPPPFPSPLRSSTIANGPPLPATTVAGQQNDDAHRRASQPAQPGDDDPDVEPLVSRFGTSEGLRLPPADEWLADNVAIDADVAPEHRRRDNALILDRAGDVEMPTHYVGYRCMRAGSPDATPPAHKVRATSSGTDGPRRALRQLTFDLPAATSRATASQANYDEWTDDLT